MLQGRMVLAGRIKHPTRFTRTALYRLSYASEMD
jgi:hypothetical protein